MAKLPGSCLYRNISHSRIKMINAAAVSNAIRLSSRGKLEYFIESAANSVVEPTLGAGRGSERSAAGISATCTTWLTLLWTGDFEGFLFFLGGVYLRDT